MFSLKRRTKYFSKTMSITRICLVKFFHFQTEFFHLEKFWNKFCKIFFFFLKKTVLCEGESYTQFVQAHSCIHTHQVTPLLWGGFRIYAFYQKKEEKSTSRSLSSLNGESQSVCVQKSLSISLDKFVE